MAIGAQQEQQEEKPQAASSPGERKEAISATGSKKRKRRSNKASEPHHSASPDNAETKTTAIASRLGLEERTQEVPSADAEDAECDAALAVAYEWAKTNAHDLDASKWIDAWREWQQVEDYCTHRTYRAFCKKYDIKRKKTLEESHGLKRVVRQSLLERGTGLMKTHTDQKPERTLHAYFGKAATGSITVLEQDVPAVVTNPKSAYLRLRLKREQYRSDADFQDLLWALNLGRNSVLSRMTIRTIYKKMSQRMQLENIRGYWLPRHATAERSYEARTVNPRDEWTVYQLQLALMREARRWLDDSERMDAISEAPDTPRTLGLLASSLQNKKAAQYLPFGKDFEDGDAYNCTQCRLLFFAEIHACTEETYGTFARPHGNLPYT